MSMPASLQVPRLGPGVGIQKIMLIEVMAAPQQQAPDRSQFRPYQNAIILLKHVIVRTTIGKARLRSVNPHYKALRILGGQAPCALPGTTARIQDQRLPGGQCSHILQLPVDFQCGAMQGLAPRATQMPVHAFFQAAVNPGLAARNQPGLLDA